jgi:hypothetical protein
MVQLSDAQAARDTARKELVEERGKRAATEADARLVHATNEQVALLHHPSSLRKFYARSFTLCPLSHLAAQVTERIKEALEEQAVQFRAEMEAALQQLRICEERRQAAEEVRGACPPSVGCLFMAMGSELTQPLAPPSQPHPAAVAGSAPSEPLYLSGGGRGIGCEGTVAHDRDCGRVAGRLCAWVSSGRAKAEAADAAACFLGGGGGWGADNGADAAGHGGANGGVPPGGRGG